MQFYASFAHNLELVEPRPVHQMSQNPLWILNRLLFLHLRWKRSNVAKGSVMDQFTSPTVPVLHGEAGPGTEQSRAEQSKAERSADAELS